MSLGAGLRLSGLAQEGCWEAWQEAQMVSVRHLEGLSQPQEPLALSIRRFKAIKMTVVISLC